MCWLYSLQRGTQTCVLSMILHLMVTLHFWRSGVCGVAFIDFYLRSSQTKSCRTCYGPIYRSNIHKQYYIGICDAVLRYVKRIVTWSYNRLLRIIISNCHSKPYKVKLVTLVESDPKANFSIATTPRCRKGTTPFAGLLHFTLDP